MARGKRMDPLVASNWYEISQSDLLGIPGARSVLHAYNGSVIQALLDLYPDIGLDESKFSVLRHEYWASVPNRRRFFEEYAKEKNFDPLIATNWYTISSDIQSVKKASSVLTRHGGSIISALLHCFPEIGLDVKKFDLQAYWKYPDNRRAVFERIARSRNLDPLSPDSWYECDFDDMLREKGITSILPYHRSSFINALLDLFPDVPFDRIKFADQSGRFWRDSSNRRLFLETFAKGRFEPLVSENWRTITKESILPEKTRNIVLSYHEGNLKRALTDLFPEIRLEAKYWSKKQNRRKFLEKFAFKNKFDPLVASNWYSISTEKFLSFQGANFVLPYYKNSLVKALHDLFPEVKFEQLNFDNVPQSFWKDRSNRRAFFEKYASVQSFDALCAENWYSSKTNSIMTFKKAKSVLEFYGGSITKALCDVFPEIGLDPERFSHSQRNWRDPKNRRRFFEEFANQNSFNPLNPQNWYNIRVDNIISTKFGRSVLFHYNNSLSKALLHLFPEINIDENCFKILPNNHWNDMDSRRELMNEFAEEKGFDPLNPENWYSLQPHNIIGFKKAASIFSHYELNVAEGLMHIFPDIGFSRCRFESIQAWRNQIKLSMAV